MIDPIPIPLPSRGVMPDADPENVPIGALIAAENWLWHDGELRVRPGNTKIGSSVAQRPTGYIHYKHSDGNSRVVKGTVDGWWSLSGSTWGDISGTALTGVEADLQVFRVFQKSGATHLLGTNGADSMKKWDGVAATYSAVGGSPPRARAMMVLFDRVIIGNLLSGGTISGLAVDVSAFQDFDSGWGTVFVGLIGIETPGEIMVMREMGSLQGAVYKSDAVVMAIAQDIGDAPFRFETKVTNIAGPASAACVVPVSDGFHVILASDGAVNRWDGVTYDPLGGLVEGGKFQAHIEKTANLTNINRAFGLYDSRKKHVWFFYPEAATSDPMVGIVINLNNLSMWPARLPWAVSAGGTVKTSTGITIGELTSPIGSITQTLGEMGSLNQLDRLLLGRTNGQSHELIGDTDDSTAIPFSLRTGRHAFGNGARNKTVKKIEHRFARTPSAQNISIEIGISDSGEDETLSPAETVDISLAGKFKTRHRETGRYLSMRMSGSASQAVTYRGSFAHVRQRGAR